MRVALVYPPFGFIENQPNIKEIADEYGIFPPLSLSYVAGILQELGHKVILIDANALKLSKDDVLRKIKDFQPEILMFTITTYLFHQTLDWIRFLKNHTGLTVIVGGVHLSLYPKETLTYKEIDLGVIGESEQVLSSLMEKLEKNKSLKNVPGLCYRDKGKIKLNNSKEFIKDLDKVPFPARNLLHNDKYYSFISQKKNFTGVITTRGCPFKCIFCEQGSKPYRIRSAMNVVDEFEECYNQYKVREIDVFDSAFSINKKRVIEICKELKNRRLDLDWSIRTRVDLVDKELLAAMSKAGCKRIYYGIESGDEAILKNIRKLTDLNIIRKIIHLTKKEGIDTFGYFMIGNPGETKKTILKTIQFAKSLNLDYAQFSKVSTLPGTELYNLLKKQLGYDYWKEYVLDESKKMILPRYNCNFSEEQIEKFVKDAYRQFYFRPGYILKALKRLKSFDELKRSLRAASQILKN